MKKMMSIVLAALLMVSMSISAFAAEDPAALLERVNAKNSTLDSMDCKAGVHAVIQVEDPDFDETFSANLDMAMNIQMDQINSGSLRYKAEMAMEMMGIQQYATVFYKDGYYYMNSDGTKFKYPMDLDSMIEKAKSSTPSIASELEASLMRNLSVREENGMKILSYEADASAVDSYMKEIMNDMLGNAGSMMDMNIRQVKGEYVINQDDYFTSMDIYMVMDMDMGFMYQKMTIIMLIESDINNPGQPVSVSLPSTDGYEDLAGYYLDV